MNSTYMEVEIIVLRIEKLFHSVEGIEIRIRKHSEISRDQRDASRTADSPASLTTFQAPASGHCRRADSHVGNVL